MLFFESAAPPVGILREASSDDSVRVTMPPIVGLSMYSCRYTAFAHHTAARPSRFSFTISATSSALSAIPSDSDTARAA